MIATILSYALLAGAKAKYQVNVSFDGYLPILGGRNATVEVAMTADVVGLPTKGDALQAKSEVSAFEVKMNGAALPFTLANVQKFFPPTAIAFRPDGKVIETDAPDVEMPIRLPGLDAKRFPEISFLPLQLDPGTLELSREFTFDRSFGGSSVQYRLKPDTISDETITFCIVLNQSSDALETTQHIETREPERAKWKLQRSLSGTGTATFDRRLGAFQTVEVNAEELTKVQEIKTGVNSERRLRTRLQITRLKDPISARMTR
jgi:hypothetical protein